MPCYRLISLATFLLPDFAATRTSNTTLSTYTPPASTVSTKHDTIYASMDVRKTWQQRATELSQAPANQHCRSTFRPILRSSVLARDADKRSWEELWELCRPLSAAGLTMDYQRDCGPLPQVCRRITNPFYTFPADGLDATSEPYNITHSLAGSFVPRPLTCTALSSVTSRSLSRVWSVFRSIAHFSGAQVHPLNKHGDPITASISSVLELGAIGCFGVAVFCFAAF